MFDSKGREGAGFGGAVPCEMEERVLPQLR